MAMIYCANCRWSQDDFWEPDGYNPFRQDIIDHLKESLFKDRVYMDAYAMRDMGIVPLQDENGKHYCEGNVYVAAQLLGKAKKILNMRWKTWEEFKAIKDSFKCPKCGSTKWGSD